MQVTLPAEDFALADLFERVPDVRTECESTVATSDDCTLLVVQTDGDEHDVDTALQSDAGVAASDCFGRHSNGLTYRVRWEGRPRQLLQRLVTADVTLLSMQGQNGQWKLQLVAPDRKKIARAYEIMDDLDCRVECRSISSFDGGESRRSWLTDEQQEALIAAFENGYYTIPRNISVENLADELGISHQALSERFRRAHRELVESTLVVDS